MRGFRQLLKRWLGDRRGFTLAELTIAMAIGSFVMGGVFLVYTQLFNVTAANSNYMAAFRQVQNAGDWITNDTLVSQGVYVMPSTELNASISDTDTNIPVSDVSSFPTDGLILIENEIISYTGTNTTTKEFTGCTRGAEATNHDNYTTVTFYVSLVSDENDTITVTSTHGFPASGVICIEDELIQYTGKTDTKFTGCTRGTNTTTHDSGTPLNFFVSLGWTDWEGDRHQVVYRLNDDRSLVRRYYIDPKEDEGDPILLQWEPQSSSSIAEAIEAGSSRSTWNYDERQLEVKLTADAGGYILGRFGFQSYEATRTYIIHPRPFI